VIVDKNSIFYHRNLKGSHLRYPRDVIVWVPPSYLTNKRRRYPVLYMHDGQNIIDPETSFLGIPWSLDTIARRLIRSNRIDEFIAVGIYNTPDRDSEYSGSQKGIHYAAFVANELKPMIDAAYRTKPGPRTTATMGASMGGLIAFLLAWWRPDVFSMAGCMSGAFMWKHNAILKEVKEYAGPKKEIRAYIDCGIKGIDSMLRSGNERMYKILAEKGYRKKAELHYYFDPRGDHNERDWSRRLWRPLTFFFEHKAR
jgi:predicted alpha/beta superfamily hydrolase